MNYFGIKNWCADLRKAKKTALFMLVIFFCVTVCSFAPMETLATGYIPPTTITTADVIATDANMMVVYPHFGSPVFVEPGHQFTAQVAAPSNWGTGGWSAWVETDYQKWDCTVGIVVYGDTNIYLDMKAGYTLPITIPVTVSPELCNLVITNGANTLRSPMSVSVVPVLETSFYTGAITDTHFYYLDNNTVSGIHSGKATGMVSKVMTIGGARYFSHTGDISLSGDVNRAVGIRDYLIAPLLQWGRVPFLQAPGNHEYDTYVSPKPSTTEGDRTGDFTGAEYDRYFGIRSMIIPMGTFAVIKHDVNAYWGDTALRNALAVKWNALTGVTYRALYQHSNSGIGTALFDTNAPVTVPVPSPNPNLQVKGHDHTWHYNQSSPYFVLSMGGDDGTTGGAGTMLNFNLNAGTWNCPQASLSYGIDNKMYFTEDCRTGSEKTSLRDSYTNTNNGSAGDNTCTITNDMNFNFYDGRVRFIMAKGNYAVTGGTVLSHYDSADGTKTIVLARVNIPVGSIASPSVTTVLVSSTDATPSPIPTLEPTPTPLLTPAPTPLNGFDNTGFEADWPNTNPPAPSPLLATTATVTRNTDPTYVHSGTSSLKIASTAAFSYADFPLNTSISLALGKTYYYSAWVRTDSTTATTIRMRFRWGPSEAASDCTDLTTNPLTSVASEGWKHIVGTYTIPVNANAVVSKRLKFYTNNTATMYLDDVYVYQVSPPAISASLPANNSAITDQYLWYVTAVFNNPMDAATLNASNVTINGGFVSNISLLGDNKTAIINFTNPISASATYSLNFGTGVKDIYGQSVASGTSITFVKGSSAPIMMSTVPSNGATGVSVNTSLVANFSKPLNPSTINTTNVTSANAPISNVELETSQSIKVTFGAPLSEGTNYSVKFGTGIKDTDGNALESEQTISFTTLPLPQIVSSSPQNNAYKVDVNPTLNLAFNINMDLSTFIAGNVTVNGRSDLVDSVYTNVADTTKCSIIFKTLQPYTKYNVVVKNFKSESAKTIPDQTRTFTTGDASSNLYYLSAPNGNSYAANGEFENTKFAPYSSTGTLSFSSSYARSGMYSLKAVSNVDYGGYDYIPLPALQPGKSYAVSVWARLDENSPSTYIAGFVHYKFSDIDNVQTVLGTTGTLTGTSPFTQILDTQGNQLAFSIPAANPGATLEVAGLILVPPTAGITYYVDDISVKEIPTSVTAVNTGAIYEGAVVKDSNTALEVRFSSAINADTMTTANIKINDSSSNIATVTPSALSDRIYTISLTPPLAAGTVYTMSFAGVKSTLGAITPTDVHFSVYEPPFAVSSFKLYKDYTDQGEEDITGSTLQPGTISAVVTGITNRMAQAGTPTVIIALYKDGQLQSVKCTGVNVNSHQTSDPVITTVDVPAVESGTYSLKAFVWGSLTDLQPIEMKMLNK